MLQVGQSVASLDVSWKQVLHEIPNWQMRQWGKVAPHKPTPWSGDEVQTLGIGLAAGIPTLRYSPLLCCGAYEWHHRNFGRVATTTPKTLMRFYYNGKWLKQSRVEPSRSDWILGSLRWPGVSLDLHEHVIFKACLTWTCGDIKNLQRPKKRYFVCLFSSKIVDRHWLMFL